MLCFKDMTFCTYEGCAKFDNGCKRSLTPKVSAEAAKWWGKGPGGAPICRFMDKPDCYEAKVDD